MTIKVSGFFEKNKIKEFGPGCYIVETLGFEGLLIVIPVSCDVLFYSVTIDYIPYI